MAEGQNTLAALFFVALVLVPSVATGQSLTLSSATASPGSTVSLNLSLSSPGGSAPAGLQWSLTYPPSAVAAMTISAGAALQSSGKSVSCTAGNGSYNCLATGLNANVISDGVVAVVNVTLSSAFAGTSIDINNVLGASPAGTADPVTATGATLTLASSTPALSTPTGSTAPPATFLALDSTTEGSWKGTYGADGYGVVGDLTAYPRYVTATPGGQYSYTWASSTTDVRALQKASSLTDRIAAAWYSPASFSIDLNFSDTAIHSVALYCLDWDKQQRSQTLTVLDAATKAVLDVRTISNFSNGQYVIWNLGGHVIIQIARVFGPNAVVNGLFFGGTSGTSAASFLKTDSTTQGAWKSAYGADGYNVIGDAAAYPGYAAAAPSGQNSWTWAASTTDARALQKAAASGGIAAAWYGNSFTLDISFSDTSSHQLALYFVDWDYQQRSQKITIMDAATGAALDTRALTSFSGGQYLVWKLSGHVKIQVVCTGGPNAVLSGVFFGGGGGAPVTSATFVKSDVATGGTWRGVYGSAGYNVIGDATAYPASVTVAPAGQNPWVWASSTTDPRALQKASSPADRIAAAWYSGISFTVDVQFSDTAVHQVALYCLDWDYRQRSQTISILDSATNAVLDTRPVSNFGSGVYLVWSLSGHVKIVITTTGGFNAVLSGLFFQ